MLYSTAHYEHKSEGSSEEEATVLNDQLNFWPVGNVTDVNDTLESAPELELVSFRELVPEISDTGYLTHAIFYYPAKFIPHVVRYALKSFTKEGDWVVDPFAGSGTVGVEAYLCRRNSFLLDLNPLLNHMIPLKVYDKKQKLNKDRLCQMLERMEKSEHRFIPEWSNIEYWYQPEILDVLSKYWGFVKNSEGNIYTSIIESSLLKMSKHFSYAEHRTPKLFKSKSKLRYIDELAREDWAGRLRTMIGDRSLETLRSINDFVMSASYNNSGKPLHPLRVEFAGGVDSSYFSFQREFDCLITSPPYLQAQEYMRTAKLDLFWLGYNDEDVKRLSRLEIPYRKADRLIQTPTLEKIRSELTRKDLLGLLDSYFCHTINALENAMAQLKANAAACIFIGNPLIDGKKVKIWRILMEYFTENGNCLKKSMKTGLKLDSYLGRGRTKIRMA